MTTASRWTSLVGVLTSFGLRNIVRKANGKEAQAELKLGR